MTTLRILILTLMLGVTIAAASSAGISAEETLSHCKAKFDHDVFKVDCRGATLQQLHTALKNASQVDLQFPFELANAPLSVVVDRVSLERLLQITLSSYNYIVSDSDDNTSGIAKVTIVGLRDDTSGVSSSSALVPGIVNLQQPDTPGPILSPISAPEEKEVSDASPVVIAGPTPGPGVKVLVNHPKPLISPSSSSAVGTSGASDVSAVIPFVITAPSESAPAPASNSEIPPAAVLEQAPNKTQSQ